MIDSVKWVRKQHNWWAIPSTCFPEDGGLCNDLLMLIPSQVGPRIVWLDLQFLNLWWLKSDAYSEEITLSILKFDFLLCWWSAVVDVLHFEGWKWTTALSQLCDHGSNTRDTLNCIGWLIYGFHYAGFFKEQTWLTIFSLL